MAITSIAEARKKLERVSNQRRREREEREEMGSRVTRFGSAAVAAPAFEFLTTRFPRMASVDAGGKIPVAPLLGGALVLASLYSSDSGDYLEGVGNGIAMPWFAGLGARAAGKF